MASIPPLPVDEAEAERYVRRLRLESERIEAEARKLMAETTKLTAEQQKLTAEERKLTRDVALSPWVLLSQGALAGAALLGAGAALARLLFRY